ncbi:MAG: ABC transporter permease, partial [Elusimicrobia bacterium]|nr:ABC transporter permease [Elusimicrobiota bacterium]
FMHGYIKAYVFAVAVSLICCYKGVTARGGAEGVGKSTTQAVVLSMVAIFVLDYLATAVLVALGIT